MSSTTPLNDIFDEDLSITIDNEILPSFVINNEEGFSKFQGGFGKMDISPLNEANTATEPSAIVVPESISIPLDFPKEIANDDVPQISINLESFPILDLLREEGMREESAVINQSQPQVLPESAVINQSQPQVLPESAVINQSQPQVLPESAVINQSQPQVLPGVLINDSLPIISGVNDAPYQEISKSTIEKEFYKELFGESFVNKAAINESNEVIDNMSIINSLTELSSINTLNQTNEVTSSLQNKFIDETLRIIEKAYEFNIDSSELNRTEEVTQSKIELPAQVIQNNEQSLINRISSQASQPTSVQMTDFPQSSNQAPEKITEIREVLERSEAVSQAPINVRTEVDLSPLEQRLARIEYALSFPLEVKIIS